MEVNLPTSHAHPASDLEPSRADVTSARQKKMRFAATHIEEIGNRVYRKGDASNGRQDEAKAKIYAEGDAAASLALSSVIVYKKQA